nr:DNA cytosine methyltransferase [Kineothrix alysoides]
MGSFAGKWSEKYPKEAGFEVICAFDNDKECATIYPKVTANNNFIYRDLKDISPKELSYTDIIIGKIIVQGFSFTHKIKIDQNGVNNSIFNIIHNGFPQMFLLEAPSIMLTKNRGEEFKYILGSYEEIGYKVVYHVFEESAY